VPASTPLLLVSCPGPWHAHVHVHIPSQIIMHASGIHAT
jgi:hypothetical protein